MGDRILRGCIFIVQKKTQPEFTVSSWVHEILSKLKLATIQFSMFFGLFFCRILGKVYRVFNKGSVLESFLL